MNMMGKRVMLSLLPLIIFVSGCQSSIVSEASSFSSLEDVLIPTSYSVNYKEARISQGYKSATPTRGNIPVLVIPVSFTDYPCSILPGGCDQVRADIETAFFGEPEETGWHSARSFYEASSYGALRLSGEVTPWYEAPVTAENLATDDNYSILTSVMRPAVTWYRETYDDDMTRFDTDTDGFIDALYFVYTVPANEKEPVYEGDDDRRFWAYTVYDNSGIADVYRPGVFHFGWSSYDFMYKDGYYDRDEQGRILRDENDEPVFHPWTDENDKILVDAHTFVHELGHFLGLPDYYTYDGDDGDWGSSGMLDMMDYNIGDHNAFSKALFGWLRPQVINNATTITLKPLVTGKDAAIIPLRYRDTLLDEYLLVEYYRPDSLNAKDATVPFAGRYPLQFTQPGIKIYHVDARPGRFIYRNGTWKFRDYVDYILPRTTSTYFGVANSNTASRSAVPHHKLIHLLEPSGENSLRHGYFANDSTLFFEGMAFDEANFPSFTFNDGSLFPFEINVVSIGEETATISITRRG